MAVTFTLILRACPESHRDAVAQLLGRAFSLKDSTCSSIAGSTPIILLGDLNRDEAAALSLAMLPLQNKGAQIEFSTSVSDDLPKIDWPRRPMVFKREISEHVLDCQVQLPIPGTTKTHSLLELLAARLSPAVKTQTGMVGKSASEFRGTSLPEITPFSNQVLPPVPVAASSAGASATAAPDRGDADAVSRLNELFPEDEGTFMPNNDDITNILNRLLPDEDQSRSANATPLPQSQPSAPAHSSGAHPISSGPTTGSSRVAAVTGAGYSVFLAKITDDNRRTKVISLLEELAKLSHDEADALSKKVIIPVLRGVRKEDAEAAKQRFAKIGILARVKGPEG
jgi:ribosomal protein L7/L12